MANYKVKSDYTALRKRKQRALDGSDIYENNLMTISPMDELFSTDQRIVPSDSNFKFSVRVGRNQVKKHARYGWLLNASGDSNWTMETLGDTSVSDESAIRIKPDYSTIRDFAYYGSAEMMIRAAINDVILRFPAELYFSSDEFKVPNEDGTKFITQGYLIHNGYGINADIPFIEKDSVDNPLRYLGISAGDYNLINKEDGKVISENLTCEITPNTAWTCQSNSNGGILATAVISAVTSDDTGNTGDTIPITIYTYKRGDEKWLFYTDESYKGISIRPNDSIVNEFFGTIDDFEYVLLDRSTKPIYKATFQTPYETPYGNKYSMVNYIWPSYNNWNPDVDSARFSKYISDLVSLAEYHDNYDTNNMWRMMTHESIKNLDWTFFREVGDTRDDLSKIDSSKIEAMIQLYARQYDGIKRYTDNIKNVNNVSYNEKNNLPDYHLTDVVELAGWEAYTISPTALTSTKSDVLYSGMTTGYDATQMNTAFMRRLKLNETYLNSIRGTRNGLHCILGLLGFKSDEYEITEEVAIAKKSASGYCNFSGIQYTESDLVDDTDQSKIYYPASKNVMGINSLKNSFDYGNEGEEIDMLQGLALKDNIIWDENEKDKIKYRYCSPWFDSKVKHDGDWYFQCKGGWGHRNSKTINKPELTSATTLYSDEVNKFTIYEETEGYMKFAENFDELFDFPFSTIKNGDVCYVTDVTGIEDIYPDGETKQKILSDIENRKEASHYFILKDVYQSTVLSDNGWKYISMTDIDPENKEIEDPDARRVVYLETIKERTEGNNPHIGKGEYDDGQEYIDYMSKIFKYAVDHKDEELTMFTENDIKAIEAYAFVIERRKDNKKCWYFSDMCHNYTSDGGIEKDGWSLKKSNGIDMGVPNEDFNIDDSDKRFNIDESLKDKPHITPYHPISGDNAVYAEEAADSVINLKNITIKFKFPQNLSGTTEDYEIIEKNRKEWKTYISDIVIEYVKQVLPATSVFNYVIDDNDISKSMAIAMDTTDYGIDKVAVDGIIYGSEDIDGIDTVEYYNNNIIKI